MLQFCILFITLGQCSWKGSLLSFFKSVWAAMACRWEYTIVTAVEKPPPSNTWFLAGQKVNNTLNSEATALLFISGSGVSYMNGQARKFNHVRDIDEYKFYQHCRLTADKLTFRPVMTKLCNVSFAGLGAGGNVKVAVSNSLTGGVYGTFDLAANDTVKHLKLKVVQKMTLAGMPGVSQNTVLKLINNLAVMQSRSTMRSLVPANLTKVHKTASRAKPAPAKGKIQTKLQVIKVAKKA